MGASLLAVAKSIYYHTKLIWACNERKKGPLDHKNEIS